MIHATSSASCLVKDLTWEAQDSEMEVAEGSSCLCPS